MDTSLDHYDNLDLNNADLEPFHSLETPEIIDTPSDLRFIEDEIFELFYPEITTRDPQFNDWGCRPNLDEIILPLGLTGAVADIRVNWINNPHEQFLKSKERGNIFFDKAPALSSGKFKQKIIKSQIIGMEISARTESKIPGMSVPVRFEAYYMTAPIRYDKAGNIDTRSKRSNDFGRISRYVTRPAQQSEYFERMARRSVTNLIGTAGLKCAVTSRKNSK